MRGEHGGLGQRSALKADLEFSGTERFEVRRRLGSGAFGVVFEGYDHERQGTVALKWLSRVDAETLHRFKAEFRSLADLSHPNLVQLFDLMTDQDRWFFSMELVRGVALPEYFRPEVQQAFGLEETYTRDTVIDGSPPPAESGLTRRPSRAGAFDLAVDEIVRVYRQLALGVGALHRAGKLHRDLKCQNVMVTPEGRVVLLDFGLVWDARAAVFQARAGRPEVAGTPLYMAPEQCAGAPVGQAVDWYAVGVMLFRTLTGELPFEGHLYEVMARKQAEDPPRPSSRTAGVPRELDDLCVRLLARDPAERPGAEEVLATLGASPGAEAIERRSAPDLFVGRRRELRALEEARGQALAGQVSVAFVHGASGIGKTSLVRHFLERLHAAEEDTWILEGRCYERESLPYKALDAVVDGLATRLKALPYRAVRPLVPAHVRDLVRVFPTLARVPAFDDAASPVWEVPDPHERRRRAAAALGDLLRRIARTRPLIVFIDDLQWGDRDSAALLRPLWQGPEAPPVLWVGTYRTREAETSPLLLALGVPSERRAGELWVEVGELAHEEARTLLELRLRGAPRDEQALDALCADAAGSPLFLDLLVRRAQSGGRSSGPGDLAAVLRERLRALPEGSLRLLELLAVRGQPLPQPLASRALGTDRIDAMAFTHLVNGRLLRVRETDDGVQLELYHDRWRTTLLEHLDADRERAHHRALLAALGDRADPESLALHHRGAGDLPRALHFTLLAARRADTALAFVRAAELYRAALALLPQLPAEDRPPVEVSALRVALGDALRNAGRSAEAAEAYLAAAIDRSGHDAVELRRRAAEQYLFGGHLDRGMDVLREVLRELGLPMPTAAWRAVGELVLRRAQVQLRGLAFAEREEPLDDALACRIDVCWSVAIGLAMIEPVRAGVFQTRHLLMALGAGDLDRVARAVAVEVPFSATSGNRAHERTARLRATGQELAERAGSPYVRGLLASSSGGAAWLEGRWLAALALEERALRILREECRGVAWELASSTIVLFDSLWRTGRWPELFERFPAILADAEDRGDRLLSIYLRIKFRSLVLLNEDRPEDAMGEARDALAQWSQPTFQLLHLWELFTQVEALLYAGRPSLAQRELRERWPALKRSQLLSLEMYDMTMHDLAGRAALAAAVEASGSSRRRLLQRAGRHAGRLEGSGAAWSRGLAALLRAGIAHAQGRPPVGSLRDAVRAFRAADMEAHRSAAEARVAAVTEPGPAAPDLGALLALGVARPERWLRVLAPGFEAPMEGSV